MFAAQGTTEQRSIMDNVEALAAVDIAAVSLVLEGKFKDKIAELKALRAEITSAQQTKTTLEAAEKIKKEAQARLDEVNAASDLLSKRVDEVEKREANVDAELAAVAAAQGDLSKREAKLQEEIRTKALKDQQTASAFDEREKRNIIKEAELSSAAANLAAQREAFNQKLANLRA